MIFLCFHPLFLLQTACENFLLPLDVKECMFLLLCLVCLLGVVYTTFSVRKEISRKVIQRSALTVGRFEWHRIWEKMALFGGKFSAPMVWIFTPEWLQDPNKVTEYLQGKCCDNSIDKQLTAVCWTLAPLYWTQVNTRECPQGKEDEMRPTSTIATQIAAETEKQHVQASAAPILYRSRNPRPIQFALWLTKRKQGLVEILSKTLDRFESLKKARESHAPPIQTRVSVTESKCPTAWKRQCTQGNLCFFLCGYREDMRKWDRKPTSPLATWVPERKNNHHRKFFMDKCHPSFHRTSTQTEQESCYFKFSWSSPVNTYKKQAMSTMTKAGGGKGQPDLLDCVHPMAWHIRSTGVYGFSWY